MFSKPIRPIMENQMQQTLRLVVRRIVFSIVVALGLFSLSASAQDYPSTEPGDQPSYPGIPPKGKVEGTLGAYNFRVYGTMLLNISASDTSMIGGDVPLWPSPANVRTTFLDGTTKRA